MTFEIIIARCSCSLNIASPAKLRSLSSIDKEFVDAGETWMWVRLGVGCHTSKTEGLYPCWPPRPRGILMRGRKHFRHILSSTIPGLPATYWCTYTCLDCIRDQTGRTVLLVALAKHVSIASNWNRCLLTLLDNSEDNSAEQRLLNQSNHSSHKLPWINYLSSRSRVCFRQNSVEETQCIHYCTEERKLLKLTPLLHEWEQVIKKLSSLCVIR